MDPPWASDGTTVLPFGSPDSGTGGDATATAAGGTASLAATGGANGEATGGNSTGGEATGGNSTSGGATGIYVPYPFPQLDPHPRVAIDWTPALSATWSGTKRRNVDAYSVPLVHRPRSETPGDAVSEGVAYGMIVALYMNDQAYFDKIWDAGEDKMWNGNAYNWRTDESGNVTGENAATDADQDIAAMLIFAKHLVDRGVWSAGHTSPRGASYEQRASDIVNSIYATMVEDGKYLKPGDYFGDANSLNPGYFAPAFYRIFNEFEGGNRWDAVINQSYDTIEANPGYSKGLLPDWMNAWGDLLADGPGYNAYDNGHSMYKDAIRIYFRLAADALWFGEPRAIAFLNNALTFLQSRANSTGTSAHANSPAHLANFYQMNGEEVPLDHIWTEMNGGNTHRSRNEHSHLTISMWAMAAVGAGNAGMAEAFSRELSVYYEGGDTWGLSSDPSGRNEDMAHNEMYFDQFLAWFGAAALNGSFCNIRVCVQ